MTCYYDICLVLNLYFQFGLYAEEVLRFSYKMVLELSKRAQQILNNRDFLDEYTMSCMHDPFNQDSNTKVSPKYKLRMCCKCWQKALLNERRLIIKDRI
jgi:hypothetical protein